MKKMIFAFAILALISSFLATQAKADVSIDYFYDNLAGGNWIEVEGYGYCWQPDVAANDSSWRPYTDGYWAYTDAGWTWISYEDFGWATYHYGRWARLADYGWIWVPGADLEWGPAWVSWRTGGDYIGWAPLPPRGPEIVYEGQPIGPQVDVEFDIGPEYYSFCDIRYIGEPVLRQRIVDYRQNVTYINQTVKVTNIRVQNNIVYNYGPDINFINQRSSRPIQRLHLERQQNADFSAAAKSGAATKVQGNNLIVATPMRLAKSSKQIAPPTVKTKVAQPKIEKGWTGIDPKTQTEIKEKFKTEDHGKISPRANITVQSGPSASPVGAGARATEQTSVGASPGATEFPGEKGKGRGKRGEQNVTGTPAVSATPVTTRVAGREHRGLHGEQLGTAPPLATPVTTPASAGTPLTGGKHRENLERGNVVPTPGGAAGTENVNELRERNRRVEATAAPAGVQGTQNPPPPNSETRGREKHQGMNAPPSLGGTAGPTTTPAERKHEGKQKGEKGSPSPTPR